jgi:hypothetical protein
MSNMGNCGQKRTSEHIISSRSQVALLVLMAVMILMPDLCCQCQVHGAQLRFTHSPVTQM